MPLAELEAALVELAVVAAALVELAVAAAALVELAAAAAVLGVAPVELAVVLHLHTYFEYVVAPSLHPALDINNRPNHSPFPPDLRPL